MVKKTDMLINLIKNKEYNFILNYESIVNIEMELMNKPSLTKEKYLLILKNRQAETKDSYELFKIAFQIDMLEKMNNLLNPSPLSEQLIPCPQGKERNPVTGRCVKVKQSKKNISAKIKSPKSSIKSPNLYIIIYIK